MTPPRQLAFSFAPAVSLAGEEFFVTECNRQAATWLDRWPDWPSPALLLCGPAGCGKTHLLQAFLAASGGRLIRHKQLADETALDLCTAAPVLAVDAADRLRTPEQQEGLLHVYNLCREANRHLLLTGRASPARWPIRLPDLRSRLNACVAVGIEPPDDTLLAAVLVKLFCDRQLMPDDGVIAFLLPRMERSFNAARQLVAALDVTALAASKPVGIGLARKVLRDLTDADAAAVAGPKRRSG